MDFISFLETRWGELPIENLSRDQFEKTRRRIQKIRKKLKDRFPLKEKAIQNYSDGAYRTTFKIKNFRSASGNRPVDENANEDGAWSSYDETRDDYDSFNT